MYFLAVKFRHNKTSPLDIRLFTLHTNKPLICPKICHFDRLGEKLISVRVADKLKTDNGKNDKPVH